MLKTRPFKVDPEKIILNELEIIHILIEVKQDEHNVYYAKEYNVDAYATLKDIEDMVLMQYDNVELITVIVEDPLNGTIYLWGNYGDNCWYETGETCGYA